MIEEIRKNIEVERNMLKEISVFLDRSEFASPAEKNILLEVADSIRKRIRMVNDSVEEMTKQISLIKALPESKTKKDSGKVTEGINKVSFEKRGIELALKRSDEKKFLDELNISEGLVKLLKKRGSAKREKIKEYKKPNLYLKLSNLFFFGITSQLTDKGFFKKLGVDLRKSNINILTSSYVSVMFFTTLVFFILGIFAFVFFSFFNLGFDFPFVSAYNGSFLTRLIRTFWIIIAVPVVTWLFLYFYPSTEKNTLSKKINQELPFVVIHMSSISGSGIEPSQIFKIIAEGREYKYTRGEIRKLLNQINVFGYDLITALQNVSRTTPSSNLSELLKGLATTIKSGGNLKVFFEKRAETLLLGYRLEREKFVRMAETFMDVYISVVIATPMILLLLLIMISVSGIGIGLSIGLMSFLIILVVGFVNVLFLTFLNLKQPSY